MRKTLQILFCVFIGVLFSSVSFAASEISVTDLDEGTRSSVYKNIYFITPRYPIDDVMYNQYQISWAYPNAADVPEPSVFSDILSNTDGSVEVQIQLRMTLTEDDAKTTNGFNTLPEEFELETIRMFVPMSSGADMSYADEITHLVIVDNNNNVYTTTLEASSNISGTTLKNESVYIYLDTYNAFPLKLYGVSYKFVTHDITVTQADNGTIFAVGSDGTNSQIGEEGVVAVNLGANQTFTVIPNDGYQVAHLIVDGDEITPENKLSASYTFTNVTDDGHTFTAVFEPYSAAAVDGGSGVTATLSSMTDSESSATITEFKALGFTDGSRRVNILSADGTESGGTFTADSFLQAATVRILYEEGYGSSSTTLSVPESKEEFSTEKNYYALVLNRSTNYYDLWPAALTADGLSVTVSPVSDYAPEAIFYVYSGTAAVTTNTPTAVSPSEGSGASSSGCNVGAAALTFLVPVYFTVRCARRR